MFENLTKNVEEIQENVDSYIHNTLEYYKLDIYKKATRSIVSILNVMLLGGILLLLLFFVSFAVAYLIGEALGNISYGFFIVAGFYLVVLVFVLVFGRKFLERSVLRSTSKNFFND